MSVTILLVGCYNRDSMEGSFHASMDSNLDIDEYEIVEIVEEENVIIYTAQSDDEEINEAQHNEHPKLAYFIQHTNDQWQEYKSVECPLDQWSADVVGEPKIWCGTLTEPRHEKVIVGETEAKIFNMDDGVKRVWYHLGDNKDEEIKVIVEDGSEEWLKEVNY